MWTFRPFPDNGEVYKVNINPPIFAVLSHRVIFSLGIAKGASLFSIFQSFNGSLIHSMTQWFSSNVPLLPQQIENHVQTMGAQSHLELVIQGEVGEPEKWLTMNKVDNIDTTEILLNVEQTPARHAGSVGEQGIVYTSMRHHEERLPVILTQH
jgi:hypothetical protein